MIEITKDQCTRMLVWDSDESRAEEALVFAKVKCVNYPYRTIDKDGFTSGYKHAKPLPEQKPKDIKMSALDVMWWAGIRKVYRIIGSEIIWCPSNIISNTTIEDREWNELIHKDGKTTLLYDEWKEFNFENCKMEE